MKNNRRLLVSIFFAAIVVMVVIEFGLRIYGLGAPLLYQRTSFGYEVKPNQDLKRFGSHIFYNEHGMRSAEVSPLSDAPRFRVLCLGDSITFGGALTDQAHTYPELLKRDLGADRFEVFNVSAGGWALDNERGWLTQHGLFGSKLLVLEIGSNDLMQPMSISAVVDGHPAFPSHNPSLALQELVYRYVLPRLGLVETTDPGATVGAGTPEQAQANLNTVKDIVGYARAHGAQVVILRIEEPAFAKDAAVFGPASRQLDDLAAALQVPMIKPDAELKKAGYAAVFRGDMVHPNAAGNEVIARVLANALKSRLQAP